MNRRNDCRIHYHLLLTLFPHPATADSGWNGGCAQGAEHISPLPPEVWLSQLSFSVASVCYKHIQGPAGLIMS